MRVLALGAVLGVAALAVAGCGSDDSDDGGGAQTTAASEKKAVNVAFVSYGLTDYQTAEIKGVKDGIAPDGGTVKVFNANFDGQKQQQQCQDAVTSGRYNAMVLLAVPGTGAACVAAAKNANIPVVTLETYVGEDVNNVNPQVPGVVGAVLVTQNGNKEAGSALAKEACKDLDPCKIIAEIVNPNDPFSTSVVDAVKKEVPGAEVVQTFAGNFDPSVISKQLPAILSAHPDTNVFLSSADIQAVAAVPVLKQAGKTDQVKILGSGGSTEGAAAIKDGRIFGSTGNFPEASGVVAAKMLIQAVNGETVDPKGVDALTLGKPLVLTKDNIDEFTPEWGPQQG